MPTTKIYKFPDINEAVRFLSGAVWASTPIGNAVSGVVGQTLTLKAPGPAGSCTFTAVGSPPNGDPTALAFSDIKAQLEAAIPGILVSIAGQRVVIAETSPNNGVTVAGTAGGGFAVAAGTVDVNTLTFGGGGSLDAKTLKLKHNGGADLNITFAAPANRAAVLSQINAVTLTDITASLDGNGNLLLTSSDAGGTVTVQVVSGTAVAVLGLTAATYTGASTNTANQTFGFAISQDSIGKHYHPVVVSNAAPCWVAIENDENSQHTIYVWE